MKKVVTLMLVLTVLFSLMGCTAPFEAEKKDFTLKELTITLTEAFDSEIDDEGDMSCSASDVVVYIIREDLYGTRWEGETFSEYSQENRLMAAEYYDVSEMKEVDGITYFEFNDEFLFTEYRYMITMYQATDNVFFIIEFSCPSKEYETYYPYFLESAKTVKFN